MQLHGSATCKGSAFNCGIDIAAQSTACCVASSVRALTNSYGRDSGTVTIKDGINSMTTAQHAHEHAHEEMTHSHSHIQHDHEHIEHEHEHSHNGEAHAHSHVHDKDVADAHEHAH